MACNSLNDPEQMMDPLVAIACDYLERVKDKTGGTLDKLVWDEFSIDERNACGND